MRLLRGNPFSCWRGAAILALSAVLAGCGTKAPPQSGQGQPGAVNVANAPLRISDRIKIDLTGTPETVEPSEQEISEDGTISIHFLGRVQAAGKTPSQLAEDIRAKLVPSIYAHANVTVLATARFFFVGGEINASGQGGRIVLSGPMTLTGAIDAAGGFSPFANRRKVRLTRVDGATIVVNCRKAVLHPEDDPPIYPGDRIFIPRRF
jgi:protein involved in polysaccharide export with SLBB domain